MEDGRSVWNFQQIRYYITLIIGGFVGLFVLNVFKEEENDKPVSQEQEEMDELDMKEGNQNNIDSSASKTQEIMEENSKDPPKQKECFAEIASAPNEKKNNINQIYSETKASVDVEGNSHPMGSSVELAEDNTLSTASQTQEILRENSDFIDQHQTETNNQLITDDPPTKKKIGKTHRVFQSKRIHVSPLPEQRLRDKLVRSATHSPMMASPVSSHLKSFQVHHQTTQDRVLATHRFFREYYQTLFEYIEQRNERYNELQGKIEQSKGTQEDIDAMKQKHFENETKALRKKRKSVQDFQILMKIGKGGFGSVYLCRHRKTSGIFAMKRIKRAFVESKNMVDHILQEKDILASNKSPWLVSLCYSFQDGAYLYLIMEFVPGGDLRGLLSNVGCFPERDSTFYLAEMILSVLDLHSLGYIHRDLKPDNFLITKEGHIKLGDFGLSKKGLRTTIRALPENLFRSNTKWKSSSEGIKRTTFHENGRRVGSPSYMPIEVVEGKVSNFAVDFWSLGVIFFELICGFPPFDDDTVQEIFTNIQNYESVLNEMFSDLSEEEMSLEARDLIQNLICPPEKRLKSFPSFRNHPLFRGLDWKNIRNMEPPFIPKLSGDADTSYFETESVEKEGNQSSIHHSRIDAIPDKRIANFSFSRSMDYLGPIENIKTEIRQ